MYFKAMVSRFRSVIQIRRLATRHYFLQNEEISPQLLSI
jgi:hypothetical protein